MPRLFVVLFCLLRFVSLAQHSINGKITDNQTGKPIEFATVYVNGTTIGTISNTHGEFELENFRSPCQIIFSHVGYNTEEISFEDKLCSPLSVALKPRTIELGGVTVPEKNKREENLLLFRKEFLGADHWGAKAQILNENILRFSWTYEKKKMHVFNDAIKQELLKNNSVRWMEDSTWAEFDFPKELKVSANEPLHIELPLLGYSLHINLESFTYTYSQMLRGYMCGYLGYYYYKPYTAEEIKRKIIRNRNKAWYHSRQHFCKALCEQKLKQNGYRIVKEIMSSEGEKIYRRIELKNYLRYSNGLWQLCGFNQQKLHLLYFQNAKGLPINIDEQKAKHPLQSTIYFLSDTCLIRPDGITPNNNMVFSPQIGAKQIGASLPANFQLNK